MKNFYITLTALLLTATGYAQSDIITLDLTKATTSLSFESENGMWSDTFNDDAESIDSQCFSFVHSSMGSYKTWWGFTASNSADNTQKSNTLTFQYSNMAKGGIVLDETGKVKTDSRGNVVVSKDVPYLVGYYNAYMAARPNDMTFTDGKSYEPVGVYVNLNSYAYYSMTCGDGYARAFGEGDKLTLTIHGVSADDSERTVDVVLGAGNGGDVTLTRGWKYVDLSTLGAVNELYFTMTSTDSGAYGMNTPGYFCLDKLMVKAADAGVTPAVTAKTALTYDRNTRTISVTGSDHTSVYDVTGVRVMSTEDATFSIAHLPAGVYVIRSNDAKIKIAK